MSEMGRLEKSGLVHRFRLIDPDDVSKPIEDIFLANSRVVDLTMRCAGLLSSENLQRDVDLVLLRFSVGVVHLIIAEEIVLAKNQKVGTLDLPNDAFEAIILEDDRSFCERV